MAGSLGLLLLAAFPLMGSPGPATLSLAAIGAAFGVSAGTRYLLGIIAGTFGVLLVVATGVTGIVLAVPGLGLAIAVVAGLYILFLAYKIATAPVLKQSESSETRPSAASGFLLAIANPKAFAAIGAVYSSHKVAEANIVLDAALKCAALLAVIIIVNASWLLFGSAFSRVLHDPRAARVANNTFAILLVLSVVLALMSV